MGNGAINLAGTLFCLMALIHLARLFCPFQVTIGTFIVPEWWSYVGFLFFGMVGLYLFRNRHTIVSEKTKP